MIKYEGFYIFIFYLNYFCTSTVRSKLFSLRWILRIQVNSEWILSNYEEGLYITVLFFQTGTQLFSKLIIASFGHLFLDFQSSYNESIFSLLVQNELFNVTWFKTSFNTFGSLIIFGHPLTTPKFLGHFFHMQIMIGVKRIFP